jgi:hypothetical protein
MNKELEEKLVIGAKIKIGKEYASDSFSLESGQIITLIEGSFDYENGLYTETHTAPSIWIESAKDYDSIYHLFGNDLEDFEDCKIIN